MAGALLSLCRHPTQHLEAVVAHVRDTLRPHFTGHVGPVRFVRGHAETDDPELVDYFRARPDEYDVTAEYDEYEPSVEAIDALAAELERDLPADLEAELADALDDRED